MRALFIGGCGRSGTTMLGDLLGVPAEHVCTPETSFKLALVEQWGWGRDPADAKRALDWLEVHRKFREFGVSLDGLRDELVGKDLRTLLDALVDRYKRQHGKPDASVWIDHTGTNTWIPAALLDAYPEARFVNLVRDGRAIAASVIPLDWGPNDVVSAARFWIENLVYGFACETRYPDRVLRVSYEDLVREPRACLTKICAFAGLRYDDAMLAGGGLRLPVSHADQHKLVGARPDPTRLDAWRNKLTPREIEMFEAEVHELLSMLGYEPMYGGVARRATPVMELYLRGRDRILGGTLNRWRKRTRMERAGFRRTP